MTGIHIRRALKIHTIFLKSLLSQKTALSLQTQVFHSGCMQEPHQTFKDSLTWIFFYIYLRFLYVLHIFEISFVSVNPIFLIGNKHRFVYFELTIQQKRRLRILLCTVMCNQCSEIEYRIRKIHKMLNNKQESFAATRLNPFYALPKPKSKRM